MLPDRLRRHARVVPEPRERRADGRQRREVAEAGDVLRLHPSDELGRRVRRLADERRPEEESRQENEEGDEKRRDPRGRAPALPRQPLDPQPDRPDRHRENDRPRDRAEERAEDRDRQGADEDEEDDEERRRVRPGPPGRSAHAPRS
jgi:hypothetical protein